MTEISYASVTRLPANQNLMPLPQLFYIAIANIFKPGFKFKTTHDPNTTFQMSPIDRLPVLPPQRSSTVPHWQKVPDGLWLAQDTVPLTLHMAIAQENTCRATIRNGTRLILVMLLSDK